MTQAARIARIARVAVVVLNWNEWEMTQRCVAALADLRRPDGVDLDVVVVDNGSTDGSLEHTQARAGGAGGIGGTGGTGTVVLANPSNLGFAGGCNPGIRHALAHGADAVWLLNNDAVPEPGALEALVTAADRPGVGVVGAVVRHAADGSVQAWGGGRVSLRTGRCRYVTDAAAPLDFVTGASLFAPRAVWEEVGLLDERFFFTWEDVELCARVRAAGWRLVTAADAVVRHDDAATVGRVSENRRYHYAAGTVRFLRSAVRHPLVPATVALLDLAGRDLGKRRWAALRGVLRGWLAGWRG